MREQESARQVRKTISNNKRAHRHETDARYHAYGDVQYSSGQLLYAIRYQEQCTQASQ